jgi:hypothetical protein
MNIKEQISIDLKEAMKARNQVLVDTLRSIMSAFTYKKVETGNDLSNEEMLAVLQKQVKQRNDSIAEYTKANRTDLLEKEQAEKNILAKYLPAQKSEAEIKQIVKDLIAGLAENERNQGNAMKVIMPQLKGLADGNLVRQIVTDELKAN